MNALERPMKEMTGITITMAVRLSTGAGKLGKNSQCGDNAAPLGSFWQRRQATKLNFEGAK